MPVDNVQDIDRLMSELIAIKKGSSEFHTRGTSSKKSNHHIEAPTGTSVPTARSFAKYKHP